MFPVAGTVVGSSRSTTRPSRRSNSGYCESRAHHVVEIELWQGLLGQRRGRAVGITARQELMERADLVEIGGGVPKAGR